MISSQWKRSYIRIIWSLTSLLTEYQPYASDRNIRFRKVKRESVVNTFSLRKEEKLLQLEKVPCSYIETLGEITHGSKNNWMQFETKKAQSFCASFPFGKRISNVEEKGKIEII